MPVIATAETSRSRSGEIRRTPSTTTYWVQLDRLREYGAQPVAERVVRDGKVITAAGVSAGIDMALQLARIEAGDEVAQAIQLGIEYDPEPPFDAGSPAKAPESVVELVRRMETGSEPGPHSSSE